MMWGKGLLSLLLLYHTGGALELIVPPAHKARVGFNAQIPCKYNMEKPPVSPRIFAVCWYKDRNPILTYDDIVTQTDPRYSLDTEAALHGTADLSISDISVSDGGVYTCSVTYSPLKLEQDIQLDIEVDVKEKYSLTSAALICTAVAVAALVTIGAVITLIRRSVRRMKHEDRRNKEEKGLLGNPPNNNEDPPETTKKKIPKKQNISENQQRSPSHQYPASPQAEDIVYGSPGIEETESQSTESDGK